MAWQEEAKFLAEDSAVRISFSENPQTGDAEMVRFWNIDREDLRESLLRFLDTYASATSPLVEHRTYVDNPIADKKAYTGRWRVVSNSGGRKKTPGVDEIGIVQTLRRGYIESIPVDPTQWTEARLFQNPTVDTSDDRLFVQWVNVSPKLVHTIAATLNATTYAAPVIRGDPYAGTWYRVSVTSTIAEDGSGVITLFLALAPYSQTFFQEVGTLKPEMVVRSFNVPKSQVAGLISAYSSASDRQKKNVTVEYDGQGMATVTASTVGIQTISDTITFTSSWDTVETQSMYLNLTLIESISIANALDVSKASMIGKDVRFSRSSNGDNTYDVLVTTRDSLNSTSGYDRDQTYTIAQEADTDELIIKKWGCTEAEVAAFITANALATNEPGKTKRLEQSREQGTGLFNVTGYVTSTALVAAGDVVLGDIGSINGDLTNKEYPEQEAETREYTWFNIASTDSVAVVAALSSASIDGWVVTAVFNRVNKTKGLHDIGFVIAKIGLLPALSMHQTVIRNVAAEIEEIVVTVLNQDTAPAAPTLDSGGTTYSLVEKQIDERGHGITNYIYVFSKDGVTEYTTRAEEVSADAERREIMLLNRAEEPAGGDIPEVAGMTLVEQTVLKVGAVQSDYVYRFVKIGLLPFDVMTLNKDKEAEEITRTLYRRDIDPLFPALALYALLERQVNNADTLLPDYTYRYVKIGTTTNLQQRVQEYLGEGQEVDVVLLNRITAPVDPTLAGYKIVSKFVDRLGTAAATYTYQFRKIGLLNITVGTRFPGFQGEQFVMTLFNRDSPPAADPTQSGYTMVEKETRGADGTLPTYVYTFVLNGDGVNPQIVGYITPGFFEREIQEFLNVPDIDLTAILATLRTISDATRVVEEVRSDFNGRGVSNITRTLIVLPASHSEFESTFETRDAALTPSTFSVISAYESYISDSAGTVAYTPTVIKVPTAFYSGNQVRLITVTRTITYHKTSPSHASSSGTYSSQTSYKRNLLANGVWVLETIVTTRSAWATSI